MTTNTDLYSILSVSKNATEKELKSAYRKQALKWHPDKHKGDAKKEAEQKFKEVNQAYEVLKNPQKKQMYDQMGHSAFTQGGSGGPQGFGGAGGPFRAGGYQQGPFKYSYSTGGNVNFEDLFGGTDPFDIFEQFFGGGGRQTRREQKPVYHITLDFMEAIKGVEKTFVIKGSQKKVNIPAGIDTNTRIRFNEFDLVVEVKPHDTFKRQGQDIIVEQKISFAQAALGDNVEVPTIDGKFKIKIRSGTQSGTLVRLRGKGIPVPRSNNRGDQYVRFIVDIPKKLSRKQKELLKEFEKES